jgi:GNAT superfamily N-acetyltransferase
METILLTWTIEPARPEDMDTLTTLVRTSDAYDGEYRVMVANQRLDTAYLDANIVRVARGADGTIYGFHSVLVPGRGADGEGELDFMFVANDQQRRGIGRALMDDVRAVARQLGLGRLHIVAHLPAEPFYIACGARRVGLIPPAGRVTWTRPHLVLPT